MYADKKWLEYIRESYDFKDKHTLVNVTKIWHCLEYQYMTSSSHGVVQSYQNGYLPPFRVGAKKQTINKQTYVPSETVPYNKLTFTTRQTRPHCFVICPTCSPAWLICSLSDIHIFVNYKWNMLHLVVWMIHRCNIVHCKPGCTHITPEFQV